jgi:hypothetical protein
MGQWVKSGQFQSFITSRVLKGLACEFRAELHECGLSVQNLHRNQELGTLCIEGNA